MTVKELLTKYHIKPYPPFNEAHVEIRERYGPGNYILSEQAAQEQFGSRHVWLAFHDQGTYDDPIHGEHVYAICID